MTFCVGDTLTPEPLVTPVIGGSPILSVITTTPPVKFPVRFVDCPLVMGFKETVKLLIWGCGTTVTKGELTVAKAPAAFVTVKVKMVLRERGPVDAAEPLATLPTPLLTMPVPLEKFGNNSTGLPLVTVAADAVRLVATGAGTAVTVNGAEIELPAAFVSVKMKVVGVFTL